MVSLPPLLLLLLWILVKWVCYTLFVAMGVVIAVILLNLDNLDCRRFVRETELPNRETELPKGVNNGRNRNRPS